MAAFERNRHVLQLAAVRRGPYDWTAQLDPLAYILKSEAFSEEIKQRLAHLRDGHSIGPPRS